MNLLSASMTSSHQFSLCVSTVRILPLVHAESLGPAQPRGRVLVWVTGRGEQTPECLAAGSRLWSADLMLLVFPRLGGSLADQSCLGFSPPLLPSLGLSVGVRDQPAVCVSQGHALYTHLSSCDVICSPLWFLSTPLTSLPVRVRRPWQSCVSLRCLVCWGEVVGEVFTPSTEWSWDSFLSSNLLTRFQMFIFYYHS